MYRQQGAGLYASISEKEGEDDLQVYPNPSKGAVWIDAAAKGMDDASLEVFDLSGRSVLQKGSIDLGQGKRRVDLGSLESGSYILRLSTEDQVRSARIDLIR